MPYKHIKTGYAGYAALYAAGVADPGAIKLLALGVYHWRSRGSADSRVDLENDTALYANSKWEVMKIGVYIHIWQKSQEDFCDEETSGKSCKSAEKVISLLIA